MATSRHASEQEQSTGQRHHQNLPSKAIQLVVRGLGRVLHVAGERAGDDFALTLWALAVSQCGGVVKILRWAPKNWNKEIGGFVPGCLLL